MAQFIVKADKLWHSGECKTYVKGDIVSLPDDTKVSDSIAPVKKGKGKAEAEAPAEATGDTPEGQPLA